MNWGALLSRTRVVNGSVSDRAGATPKERRSSFQKDFDRVVYSTPFRRLQNKTQVHTLPNNDHIRNRLTHSIEASTIARSLGLRVGHWLRESAGEDVNPEDVATCAQAATVAHDIGNTPFGHAGEEAIQEWFSREDSSDVRKELSLTNEQKGDFIHFNGNAQGFRVLTKAPSGYRGGGLELTCAVLASFVKYPHSAKEGGKGPGLFADDAVLYRQVAAKLGIPKLRTDRDVWARHPLVFLVEAADDAAYLTADIEDGVELGLFTVAEAIALFKPLSVDSTDDIHGSDRAALSRYRSRAIGGLIDRAQREFSSRYTSLMLGSCTGPLLDADSVREIADLRNAAQQRLFPSPAKIKRELAGREALEGLLSRFARTTCPLRKADWDLDKLQKASPNSWRLVTLMRSAQADDSLSPSLPRGGYDTLHMITDFIAGQTDRYAIDLWRHLRGIDT